MPKLTGIALGLHADGSLELVAASVAQGSGPTMWHAQQRGPSGDWSGWQPFGKPGRGNPGTPSLRQHGLTGRLEVFVATGGDQAVWHRWQTGPGPDDWSDWEPLGQPGRHGAGIPVFGPESDPGDGLRLFTSADVGAVWYKSQHHYSDPSWSGPWKALGQPYSDSGRRPSRPTAAGGCSWSP
jgi:hypothetical protein